MPRSRRNRFLFWIAAIYVGLLLAFHALLLLPAIQDFWVLRVANIFAVWAYLPLPLLLILGAIADRRTIALLILPLMLFSIDFGVRFLPVFDLATGGDRSLRLLTWNVHFRNTNVDELQEEIATHNPDVVALQELTPPLTSTLAAALQTDYPFQAIAPDEFGVFSRCPIQSVPTIGEIEGRRRFQEVRVSLGGGTVTLLNVHLPTPRFRAVWRRRRRRPFRPGFDTDRQDVFLEALLAHLEQWDGPLLVAGDFNIADRMVGYRRLQARLQDTFRERGWGLGLTYPTVAKVRSLPWGPIVRIDYIFHNDDLRAERVGLGEAEGADHRYLVADFSL